MEGVWNCDQMEGNEQAHHDQSFQQNDVEDEQTINQSLRDTSLEDGQTNNQPSQQENSEADTTKAPAAYNTFQPTEYVWRDEYGVIEHTERLCYLSASKHFLVKCIKNKLIPKTFRTNKGAMDRTPEDESFELELINLAISEMSKHIHEVSIYKKEALRRARASMNDIRFRTLTKHMALRREWCNSEFEKVFGDRYNGLEEESRHGNSLNHEEDLHVSMEQRPDYYFHPTMANQQQMGMNLPMNVPTLPITYPPPTALNVLANQELPFCVLPFSFPNEAYPPCEYGRFYAGENAETNAAQLPPQPYPPQGYSWQCELPQGVPLQTMDVQRSFIPANLYTHQPHYWPPSYINQYYENQSEFQNQCINWEPAYNPGLPQMPFHAYNKEVIGANKGHNYRPSNGNKQGKATAKQVQSLESVEKLRASPMLLNEQPREKQEMANNETAQEKNTERNASFEEQKLEHNNHDKMLHNFYKELEEELLPFMPVKTIQNLVDKLKKENKVCSYTLLDDVSTRTAELLKPVLNSFEATALLIASTNKLKLVLQEEVQDPDLQPLENAITDLLASYISQISDLLRGIAQHEKTWQKANSKSGDTIKTPAQSKKFRQHKRLTKTKKKQDGTSSPEGASQDRN